MIEYSHIEESIRLIKQKLPYYGETEAFWAAALEGIGVDGSLLVRLVSRELIDSTEKPSATRLRHRLMAIERNRTLDERRDVARVKLKEGQVLCVTGWTRESGYTRKAAKLDDTHEVQKGFRMLKCDYATAILGWIATDILQTGGSIQSAYTTARVEVATLGREYELRKILDFYGYSDARVEKTRKIDPFEALAAQKMAESGL